MQHPKLGSQDHRGVAALIALAAVLPATALAEGNQTPSSGEDTREEAVANGQDTREQTDARGEGSREQTLASADRPAGEQTERPFLRPDDTWIRINGTVDAVSANSFTLDYGPAEIVVEFDDADRDSEGYQLLSGDRVTVAGIIDDDFFEVQTIEASSVYVDKVGTYFRASAVDESVDTTFLATEPGAPVSAGLLRGTVTDVGDDSFTLSSDTRRVTVGIGRLDYDPLDEEGYQRIEEGDLVSVRAELDDALFDERRVDAESVIVVAD